MDHFLIPRKQASVTGLKIFLYVPNLKDKIVSHITSGCSVGFAEHFRRKKHLNKPIKLPPDDNSPDDSHHLIHARSASRSCTAQMTWDSAEQNDNRLARHPVLADT